MAVRLIRKDADEILRKKSREVSVIDERMQELVDDMFETMHAANGVGLAAVQVGVLKRVIVVDVGEEPFELINPELIEEQGEQFDVEGCLSIPGKYGQVKRPAKVTVKGQNRKGQEIIVEGEGLLAVCLCHEIDHLNGVLFTDKVIRYVDLSKERRREKS